MLCVIYNDTLDKIIERDSEVFCRYKAIPSPSPPSISTTHTLLFGIIYHRTVFHSISS